MSWFHYNPRYRKIINVKAPAEVLQLKCDLGTVSTGKTRVFNGYYAQLHLADGSVLEGRDPYHLRSALEALAVEAATLGLALLICGVAPDFYETGLTGNSGGGYCGDRENAQPRHMLDPLDDCAPTAPLDGTENS